MGNKLSLQEAAKRNKKRSVERLLNAGADANERGEDGLTPLHHAAINDAAEVAHLLLQSGGDANATTSDGSTPLRIAISNDATHLVRPFIDSLIASPGPHRPAADSDLANPCTHVALTTNDGAAFLPERDLITEHSGLLRDLLADADCEVVKDPVPLPNVASRELTHMLWLLQQDFNATQMERCIAAFDIEDLVALQEAANFMDVRSITAACAGVIAKRMRKAADGEEKAQLLELVTPPRLPQDLCELWMGRCVSSWSELLQLLAKYPDSLVAPLAQWESAWALRNHFSEHRFDLRNEAEVLLLKARSEHLEHVGSALLMYIKVERLPIDDGMCKLADIKRLGGLALGGCVGLTDAGLAHIERLTRLTSLNLWNCTQITNAGFAHVKAITQLNSLDLWNCTQITDAVLELVGSCVRLVSLILRCCHQITDAGLAHLKELAQLTSLDLTGCLKITDTGLEHIKVLTQLTSLQLEGCDEITDAGLAHVAALRQLTALSLRGCRQITRVGLAHVATLEQLTFLNLWGCTETTDTGLAHLTSLTNLQYLNLWDCRHITNAGLARLKTLSRLTTLALAHCPQITDEGCNELARALPGCRLDLSRE